MARGNDERHNPSRRPMGREEALNYIMKTFPGSEVVSDVDEDEEVFERALNERNQSSYDEDEYNPPERAEDAHLDMMYEDRYAMDDLTNEGYNEW